MDNSLYVLKTTQIYAQVIDKKKIDASHAISNLEL